MAQNFADLYTPINTAQKNTTPSKRQPDLAFLVLPTRHSPTLLISSLLHENPHQNFLVSGGLGDLVPADHAPRLRTASSRVNALRWPPTPCPSGVPGRWPVAGISHPSHPHGTGYHPALSKHIPLPAVGVAQEPVRATSQQLTPRNPAQEGAARRNRARGRDEAGATPHTRSQPPIGPCACPSARHWSAPLSPLPQRVWGGPPAEQAGAGAGCRELTGGQAGRRQGRASRAVAARPLCLQHHLARARVR